MVLRKGFVSVRTPLRDEAFAKVHFGGERVVCRAAQRQIRDQMRTTHSERLQMMQFEIVRLSATQATLIDIRAARTVAPIHFAPHRPRDVSTALARWSRRRFAVFGHVAALMTLARHCRKPFAAFARFAPVAWLFR